jgi:hypothetical protein
MGNVIAFPSRRRRAPDLSVLIWQGTKGYHVTVFDHGHERFTETFDTYADADATTSYWRFMGATIEDRVGGDGAA